MFIHGFIGSYNGFAAGKGICFSIKEDQGMGKSEIFGKSDFIALALNCSVTLTIIYEDVPIKELRSQFLPHGIIDLVTFTRFNPSTTVARMSSGQVLIV